MTIFWSAQVFEHLSDDGDLREVFGPAGDLVAIDEQHRNERDVAVFYRP